MFTTLKRKYQRKKRELKDSNKSGTSAEAVSKAEKAFRPYVFLNWLDDFFASRQGKSNLPSKDQDIDDEEDIYEEEEEKEEEEQENQDEEIEVQSFEEDLVPGASTSKPEASTSKPNNKTKKKPRSEIKGSARENLLEDMEFSLIKNLNERVSKKRKTGEETKEDLFCKSIAADLKDLPPYERCIAKNEIRNIMFKLQMSAMTKQQNPQPRVNSYDDSRFNAPGNISVRAPTLNSWGSNSAHFNAVPSPMSSPTSSIASWENNQYT